MITLQPEFREAIGSVDTSCAQHFNERLTGAYVAGSVAAGEALSGISDLDWWVFLQDEPTAADRTWSRRLQRRVEYRFPIFPEAHVNVYSLDRLGQEGFWRFILRYNSLRVRGRNVVALLERRGHRTPRPSGKLAKSRLPFVRQCLAAAVNGQCPPALARLPANPYLATRKLARNFMVVETAFLLMNYGMFESFKQEVVFSGLASITNRWNGLIDKTRRILADPLEAAVKPHRFMIEAESYVNWLIVEIEKSSTKRCRTGTT